MGAYKHMGHVWMPPRSPHTIKLNSQAKCCSTAMVSFSFLKWSGRGLRGPRGSIQGGHWIIVYEHGYEKRKDHRTELQAEGRFRTLLLPVLVAWNTLDTRGSTASHRHIEISKSCNSYHSKLFSHIYGNLQRLIHRAIPFICQNVKKLALN